MIVRVRRGSRSRANLWALLVSQGGVRL